MKTYFAYIRVSTVKQGERGSSLQEQRAAIEAFAQRQKLTVSEWFEDRETAAKKGRTQFLRMMGRLEKGKAAGVLLHKIDRGARNLWDWARIQSLLDAGIEVHFVHDNLDMSSRGGRLAADIQAVVAADYVRNLRDEVHKGQRGRLKQGLYPFGAPIGYLNNGRGQAKTIDPVRGPLVRLAFELYASRRFSFDTLRAELRRHGLTRKNGGPLSRCSITAMLRNPFYAGVLRVKSTGEHFAGAHEALIGASLFKEVQDVLDGKAKKGPLKREFLYRKLFACASCRATLVGERQKGIVYYRCHTKDCPTTGIREDEITKELTELTVGLQFIEQDIEGMTPLLDEEDKVWVKIKRDQLRTASLRVSAIEERERRLTDAYIDKLIERDAYSARRGALLLELAEARETHQRILYDDQAIGLQIKGFFEFMSALRFDRAVERIPQLQDVLRIVTSNRTLSGKNACATLQTPFREISSDLAVLRCPPLRDASRTFSDYRRVADVLRKHLQGWVPPPNFIVAHKVVKRWPRANWRQNLQQRPDEDFPKAA